VITETMEARPDIGLDSYDRLFPNQDTMPQGGFGNLIALPLQKGPRKQDNSVFLDDNFVPWTDQWAFLAGTRRIGRTQVERTVEDAERRGRILGVRLPPQDDGDDEPWTAPPSRHRKEAPIVGALPPAMELVLGNQIYIAKEGLHPGLRNRLLRLAAFQNPEFYRAQAMRLSTYDKPRVVACAEDHAHHIGLPRGCLDDVRQALTNLGVRTAIRDERHNGSRLDVSFRGELRREQKAAADAMLRHETGILAATTAFGKTVVAAWLIAQRGVNTLVLVHRRQLLDQWVERLSTFLDMPAKSIGRMGGGRSRPTGMLDVAIIQSLVRKGVVNDCVAEYGHVIVDECHHLSAHSFEQVTRRAKARFVVGLSATVARKDGHHPIIFMQCGPGRHRVNARTQAASRPFEHFVLVQPTAFLPKRSPDSDKRVEFQGLYQELISDEVRTRRICDDVIESVRDGRSPLVLTERNDHLDLLEQGLANGVRHVIVLRAGMGKKQRQAVADRLAAIPRDEARVILATGKYVGEGFDDPRLDTLFLTLPVSWRGTIAQYAGRLHRLYDGKREVRIYDYADLNVPMLARMFDRRCRGYEAVGYTISFRPARSRVGPQMSFCLRIRCGSGITRAACKGSFETASIRRSPRSLFMRLGRGRQTPMVQTELGVPQKRFSIADWKPWGRRRVASASTLHCRSRSMASDNWRSISCVPIREWQWSWMGPSIWRIRSRTAAIVGKINCCRRAATWCCVSLPKMLAGSWTWCSMRS